MCAQYKAQKEKTTASGVEQILPPELVIRRILLPVLQLNAQRGRLTLVVISAFLIALEMAESQLQRGAGTYQAALFID